MRGRIEYVGHATVFVDLDGVRLLTDPLLRNRVAHLRRSTPVSARSRRGVDAVLISHAHYDHLDLPSLEKLGKQMPVVVPRERIRYAFYATAGHFDPPRSVNEVTPGVMGTIHLESRYVPPATLDDVPVDANGDHVATMWIVVRDDRGGDDWLEAHLVLDPAP